MALEAKERDRKGSDPLADLKCLILYDRIADDYGIIDHSSRSVDIIWYCPWCGKKINKKKDFAKSVGGA